MSLYFETSFAEAGTALRTTRTFMLLLVALSSGSIHARSAEPANAAVQWNTAALQGIRDAKLGAPVVARALAIVHTCM